MKVKNIYSLLVMPILLIIGLTSAKGQEQLSLRSTAEKLYYQYEYYNASRIYEKLLDTKRPRVQDMERLAECYYRINNYTLAQNWYARVIAGGKFSDQSQLNYAETLKKNGNYSAAKEQFTQYGTRTGNTSEVALAIQGADSAILWMASPTLHKLKNEEIINTRYSEFGTTPLYNSVLYVGEPSGWAGKTSGMTGRPYLRIYSSSKEQDGITLKYPSILPDVFNNAPYPFTLLVLK